MKCENCGNDENTTIDADNDGSTQVIFILPTSAAIGYCVEISGKDSDLIKVAQSTEQQFNFGNSATTIDGEFENTTYKRVEHKE